MSPATIRGWIINCGLPACNTRQAFSVKVVEFYIREFFEQLNVYVDWGAVVD